MEIIKKLVREQVNAATFEEQWQQVVKTFAAWKSSATSHQTSDLISQLELIKIICVVFPNASLQKNKEIVDLVLSGSGARNIGYSFKCRLPNGRTEMTTIVNREISDGFGILYTLETAEGFRFTHEFFD